MTIRNTNKDHLKEHGGMELVESSLAPTSGDPLRFWTNHPTDNTLVDLRVFAKGESKNPNPTGGSKWAGPFSGRPELIAELAAAIQARLTMAFESTWSHHKNALRAFWRMLDQLEATGTPDGRRLERLISVRDLTHLHEAAMHRAGISPQQFGSFLNLANDSRRLMRLGILVWTIPSIVAPIRRLIPDDQAKELKIAIKRDWERVRKTWDRHDAIRRGEEPDTLTEFEKQDAAVVRKISEQNETLRRNWLYFESIQKATGRILPTSDQLYDGRAQTALNIRGLWLNQMRAISFPTTEDADIAFHSALMGSGWNPSTLVSGLDATLPERIFPHPKDQKQSVLVIDAPGDDEGEIEEVTMQGSKRRAGGRLQFCMGLKKNPDSPPVIVAAYLERTATLREQLRQDCKESQATLARLRAEDAPKVNVEHQIKRLLILQQGIRNVWLYVDRFGHINWIDGSRKSRYQGMNSKSQQNTYLDGVIERINVKRVAWGKKQISQVVPSDFRDIFARWIHVQTGGNIIAVMFALGHASLRSTNAYIDNNIFNAESSETVRSFMTHLFDELEQGRVDLTLLAQLVRHGPVTPEMNIRLEEYRSLMRSRVKTGCANPKHPPTYIAPDHIEGKWCATQCCLRNCPHARFLPESVDGIAMRVEELVVMSNHLPLDTWMRGEFEKELVSGDYLLADLYPQEAVNKARAHWREKIRSGKHVVPGVGILHEQETA